MEMHCTQEQQGRLSGGVPVMDRWITLQSSASWRGLIWCSQMAMVLLFGSGEMTLSG